MYESSHPHLHRYANHLVEKGDICQAIELYQKAEYHTEAAKLLASLGSTAGKQQLPLRAKKFYVLAAIAIDKYKKRALASKTGNMMDALLSADKATATDRTLDNAWKGAEAYHFFLLAQQQLLERHTVGRAMVTAARLMEYDDVLDEVDLFSLIALASYLNKCYALCSKAFIRLESIEARGGKRGDPGGNNKDVSAKDMDEDAFHNIDSKGGSVLSSMGALTRKAFGMGGKKAGGFVFDFDESAQPFHELAIRIFTRHPPTNQLPTITCLKCKADTPEWFSACQSCGTSFQVCIVSGRTIQNDTSSSERVESCKRYE